MANQQLGKIGVWLAYPQATPELARELEALGYGAIWVGASPAADWEGYEALLAATETLTVGTSIVNVWATPAKDIAATYHRLAEAYPGRFLLGVGIGHPEHATEYTKPYDALVNYLDQLDEHGVPRERRALAALGPRVARLAADRTAGPLPYLTVPEHTAALRAQLGPDALIVTEHKAVLDADPATARATARGTVGFYLGLSNYVNNLHRYGFDDADTAQPGSDRLIDALVAHGTPDEVADHLLAHVRAGADQVAVQPLGGDPLPILRTLAPLLTAKLA
ncbi:LLM class F420-dependent oxidoreductase [Nocardia sp. NPDC057668]|uniref:LLM class F420-dependent oxidoreductase n=1 Tax=Nocardia sp. NPDC057668 TaxID=3346202 RepID=UPI003670CB4D